MCIGAITIHRVYAYLQLKFGRQVGGRKWVREWETVFSEATRLRLQAALAAGSDC